VGTKGSFLGGKAAGTWADHSPPSSVVKNAWSYTSTPSIRLRGVVLSWSTRTTLALSYQVCTCLGHRCEDKVTYWEQNWDTMNKLLCYLYRRGEYSRIKSNEAVKT
jgi:hypothetical protein